MIRCIFYLIFLLSNMQRLNGSPTQGWNLVYKKKLHHKIYEKEQCLIFNWIFLSNPPRAAWIFMKCVFIQRWRLSDLRGLLIRLSASPSGYHAHIWSGCDLLRWLNGLDDLMGNINCCKSNWPPAWRYGIVGALGCGEGRVLLQSERRMRISPVLPLYLRSAAAATARLFLHY